MLVDTARGHLGPIEDSLKTRHPQGLEAALSEKGGKCFLETLSKVRKSKSIPHLHRQAFESAMATHMVRARAELGRWQAGVKEIKKAVEGGDPKALEAALKRWAASAGDAPEVLEARAKLEEWRQVAEVTEPVLANALASNDLIAVQAIMRQLEECGPRDVTGSDKAREKLDRYDVKTRRLRYGLTERNVRVVEAALKSWEFGAEDPVYVAGAQMLARREQQIEELRTAASAQPLDGRRLDAAVRAWQFEARHPDIVLAMDIHKRYAHEDALLRSLAAGAPAELLRLRASVEAWPFAPEESADSSFALAVGALDTYAQGLRSSLEASDGRALRKLWGTCGSGVEALRSEDGDDATTLELDELARAVPELLARHREAETELQAAMAQAQELPAMASPEVSRLVEGWAFSRNDPVLVAAQTWLRLHAGAAERSSRDLAAATATGCAEVVAGAIGRCQALPENSEELASARAVLRECGRARAAGYAAIVAAPGEGAEDSLSDSGDVFSLAFLEAPALASAWLACGGTAAGLGEAGGIDAKAEGRRRQLHEGLERLEAHAVAASEGLESAAAALAACAVGSPDGAVAADAFPRLLPPRGGDLELTVQRISGEVVFQETVCAQASVSSLKQALEAATGVPTSAQRLLLDGAAQLQDGASFADQGVESGAMLTLVQLPPPLLGRFQRSRERLRALTSKDLCDKISCQRIMEPIKQLRLAEGEASVRSMIQALDRGCEELHRGGAGQVVTGAAMPAIVADATAEGILSFSGSVVPVLSLARSAGSMDHSATGSLAVAVVEFTQTVPFFFEHFVPLRAAWIAAQNADVEAKEALARARRATHAILRSSGAVPSAALFEARALQRRRKAESAVLELLGSVPEESDFGLRLRWVQRLLTAQTKPVEDGRQELLARTKELREADLSSFLAAGASVHAVAAHSSSSASSRPSVRQAGFFSIAAALNWLLRGKSKGNTTWEGASLLLADVKGVLLLLQGWGPRSRGATAAPRLESARRLLSAAVPWAAEGCGDCPAAQKLFAWAAVAVALEPWLPRAKALAPTLHVVEAAAADAIGSEATEEAWRSVCLELGREADIDALWWLRLCGCPADTAAKIHQQLDIAEAATAASPEVAASVQIVPTAPALAASGTQEEDEEDPGATAPTDAAGIAANDPDVSHDDAYGDEEEGNGETQDYTDDGRDEKTEAGQKEACKEVVAEDSAVVAGEEEEEDYDDDGGFEPISPIAVVEGAVAAADAGDDAGDDDVEFESDSGDGGGGRDDDDFEP